MRQLVAFLTCSLLLASSVAKAGDGRFSEGNVDDLALGAIRQISATIEPGKIITYDGVVTAVEADTVAIATNRMKVCTERKWVIGSSRFRFVICGNWQALDEKPVWISKTSVRRVWIPNDHQVNDDAE